MGRGGKHTISRSYNTYVKHYDRIKKASNIVESKMIYKEFKEIYTQMQGTGTKNIARKIAYDQFPEYSAQKSAYKYIIDTYYKESEKKPTFASFRKSSPLKSLSIEQQDEVIYKIKNRAISDEQIRDIRVAMSGNRKSSGTEFETEYLYANATI